MFLENIYGIFRFLGVLIVLRTLCCGIQSLILLKKDYNFGFKGYRNTLYCFLVVWLFCWLCSTRTELVKFIAPFYAFQITLVIVTAATILINIMIEQQKTIIELRSKK